MHRQPHLRAYAEKKGWSGPPAQNMPTNWLRRAEAGGRNALALALAERINAGGRAGLWAAVFDIAPRHLQHSAQARHDDRSYRRGLLDEERVLLPGGGLKHLRRAVRRQQRAEDLRVHLAGDVLFKPHLVDLRVAKGPHEVLEGEQIEPVGDGERPVDV